MGSTVLPPASSLVEAGSRGSAARLANLAVQRTCSNSISQKYRLGTNRTLGQPQGQCWDGEEGTDGQCLHEGLQGDTRCWWEMGGPGRGRSLIRPGNGTRGEEVVLDLLGRENTCTKAQG